MSTYGVGAAVRLSTEVRDSAKALVTPSSVTVTIRLPNGTLDGPHAPTVDGTGIYHYDHVTAVAGHHIARWDTVSPTSNVEEPFDVAAQWGEAGIISLAEARRQVKLDAGDTSHDADLAAYIRSVTEICERHVGAIVRAVHVEKHAGGYAVALRRRPILSITSVVGVGVGVTQTVGDLDPDLLAATFERTDGAFMPGPVRVTYVAGRAQVPDNVLLAALIILQHLWRTRLGGPVQTATVEEPTARVYGGQMPSGFAVPNRAIELLGQQMGGFA